MIFQVGPFSTALTTERILDILNNDRYNDPASLGNFAKGLYSTIHKKNEMKDATEGESIGSQSIDVGMVSVLNTIVATK